MNLRTSVVILMLCNILANFDRRHFFLLMQETEEFVKNVRSVVHVIGA